MELAKPYLNFGRSLFADNWYTSVDLAHKLNKEKTHLVGTLRANRKLNPKCVVKKKKIEKGRSHFKEEFNKCPRFEMEGQT